MGEKLRPEFSNIPPEIVELMIQEEDMSLVKKAEDVWEKGKNESEPKAEFHIIYRRHFKPESAERAGQLLSEYDLFIPESPNWNSSIRESWRQLSSGQLSVEEMLNKIGCYPESSEYVRRKAEFQRLYQTNEPIAFVDVPQHEPLLERMEAARSEYGFKKILDGTFEDSLRTVSSAMQKFGQTQKDRENYMIEHIPDTLKEALVSYPELKQKGKIKVLMELGVGHTPVYQKMKLNDLDVTREINVEMPYAFYLREEGMRRYSYDKEVSEEFLSKVVLEKLIYSNISQIIKTLGKEVVAKLDVRQIAEKFGFELIKKLFEDAKQGSINFTDNLAEVLRKKHLI